VRAQQIELANLLPQEGKSLEDVHDRLKSLFRRTVEQMLEDEMDEHNYGRQNE
jgi:transposase-like protein